MLSNAPSKGIKESSLLDGGKRLRRQKFTLCMFYKVGKMMLSPVKEKNIF
jgi:hypothetical protein